jgi:hypothetical protein
MTRPDGFRIAESPQTPRRSVRLASMARRSLGRPAGAALLLLLLLAPAAAPAAGLEDPTTQWLPRSDGAEWVYAWSNSAYSPSPRRERYQVTSRTGESFRVSWREIDLRPEETPAAGTLDYRHTDAGLVNANYQSTQPPAQFPPLCSSSAQCGNSVAGTHFLLLWGTRSPVLAEPLLRGTRWSARGGGENDVTSTNRYLGLEMVKVPAFPTGVLAAKVESDVNQAGALGDPFGSGLRTVWWVYGVGPVKILLQHAGGETSQSELQSTNLGPLGTPPDANLLPFSTGAVSTYRWRNNKHMSRWSHQGLTVTQVVNNTARVDVESVSGPLNVRASYTFSTRLGGVRNLAVVRRRANRGSTTLPRLGPRGGPAVRRRFYTPLDLMLYGYNPILPSNPVTGDGWRSSRDTRDFANFGVVGQSKVIGLRTVETPAGEYRALVVRSRLRQSGSRFGSGTRTSWFADGVGLVRLVFRHDDGSTSTVERTLTK